MRRNTIWAILVAFCGMAVAACYAVLAGGCHVFEGPATQEHKCPVFCGRDVRGEDVCCAAHQECSKTGAPEKPCRQGEPIFGAALDGGGLR